jgi:hypothetical protein
MFRLSVLGAPKSGKTTTLRDLSSRFGAWDSASLTARLYAETANYGLRETPPEHAFRVLGQRLFLLDGVILFCDLSLPLPKVTLAHLHFARLIGVPLRMIVATHCEAFAGEQELLDECELSLRELLATVDIPTNAIPIVHSNINDSREEEIIERLQAIEWGAPFTERPLLMCATKARDVTRSESIVEVRLMRGTARPTTPIEAVCWGRRSLRGTIIACGKDNVEMESIKAPSNGQLRLNGVHPTPGSILSSKPIKNSTKGSALLFVHPSDADPRWIPYAFLRELFDVSGDFLQEKVWLSPPREFFFSEGFASTTIELEVDSPSFLFRGLYFEWSYRGYIGGGVVTEVHR